MNRRWFIEIEGRAQGPFDQSQVQDLARLKRISPLSRIFLEGDVRWRLMSEFDEFKIVPESGHHGVSFREWVILKRKPLKEAELSTNKFDQVGPFTIAEIDEQLRLGELSYNDYAWKKGFQRWAKLETLSEFNRTLQPPLPPELTAVGIAFVNEPKLDLNDEEQEELGHFTNTQKTKLPAEQEEVAVRTSDEGSNQAAVMHSLNQVKESELEPKQEEEVEDFKSTRLKEPPAKVHAKIENLKAGLSLPRKLLRIALAALAAVTMTLAVYQTLKKENSDGAVASQDQSGKQVSAPIAEPVIVEQPQPSPTKPIAPIPQSTQSLPDKKAALAKADFEMPKVPKLEIEILHPEGAAQIILSTNAPVNHPIEVKLTGKSGQILRYVSYSQTLKIQRQGGEVPSVDLAALKLPFGSYTVQAQFGEILKQKTFFYGVKDENFQKQLTAQVKKISGQQVLEKKLVFYYLRDLEDLTKKLETKRPKSSKDQASWKVAYTSWRRGVARTNSKAFAPLKGLTSREVAYPDLIAKAREFGPALLKNGEEMNSTFLQERRLSSSEVGSLLASIRSFKKEVGALSRY